TLWLQLGHDVPSQSYFLLRAEVNTYNGIGVWTIDPRIDAVTANDTVFRHADAIKSAILAGLTALHQSAMPWTGSSRLVFASDFDKGVVMEDQKHLLYAIDTHRPTNWRTGRGEGQWQ